MDLKTIEGKYLERPHLCFPDLIGNKTNDKKFFSLYDN